MNITSENINDFNKIANNVPTLIMFWSKYCGHCLHAHPYFVEVEQRYENDPHVMVAECECTTERKTCDAIAEFESYPTFVVLLGDQTLHVKADRTTHGFVEIVETMKSFDPKVSCKRHILGEGEVPYAVVTFDVPDSDGCKKLEELEAKIPNAIGGFRLGQRTNESTLRVITGRMTSVAYTEGMMNVEGMSEFVMDYLHPSMEGWSLKTEWRLIKRRRLGFFVYGTDGQVRDAMEFGVNTAKNWVFATMSMDEFNREYPEYAVNGKDMPMLALLSKDKAMFMVKKRARMDWRLEVELKVTKDLDNESEMIIPFKYYSDVVEEKLKISHVMDGRSVVYVMFCMMVLCCVLVGVVFRWSGVRHTAWDVTGHAYRFSNEFQEISFRV